MPIKAICVECNKQYTVPDQHAGKRVKCPAGHHFIVPVTTIPTRTSHMKTKLSCYSCGANYEIESKHAGKQIAISIGVSLIGHGRLSLEYGMNSPQS